MRPLTLIILLHTSASFSQNKETKDPKAKEILDKISKKTDSYNSLKIKFDYKIINNQTRKEHSYKGYAFLQKDKYKLIIPGIEIISDAKSVWTYQKEVKEVSVDYADPEDESIFNPAKLFTIYKRGFKYKLIGEYNRKEIPIAVIDLFPEDIEKKNFTRARIETDTEKYKIVSVTTFGKDGIDYVIELNSLKPDIKIPDNFFTFSKDKYPDDVEIIDMR